MAIGSASWSWTPSGGTPGREGRRTKAPTLAWRTATTSRARRTRSARSSTELVPTTMTPSCPGLTSKARSPGWTRVSAMTRSITLSPPLARAATAHRFRSAALWSGPSLATTSHRRCSARRPPSRRRSPWRRSTTCRSVRPHLLMSPTRLPMPHRHRLPRRQATRTQRATTRTARPRSRCFPADAWRQGSCSPGAGAATASWGSRRSCTRNPTAPCLTPSGACTTSCTSRAGVDSKAAPRRSPRSASSSPSATTSGAAWATARGRRCASRASWRRWRTRRC
mmetsp:Transcript_3803/g.11031  ORF Transcript_3803/g.11031 Transcript_3803/m.11031 type:complete len:281 (+) Transcript_3803:516-1358(+)